MSLNILVFDEDPSQLRKTRSYLDSKQLSYDCISTEQDIEKLTKTYDIFIAQTGKSLSGYRAFEKILHAGHNPMTIALSNSALSSFFWQKNHYFFINKKFYSNDELEQILDLFKTDEEFDQTG